ncbi:MAG: V-type ATPase subunit [Synergistales bacterium]|nr:V-type ATPase subunit [Synergistales bacterium]
MVPSERYAYTVARLRAMENRLLDESVLQRLFDSEDLDSAMKVLGETPYSSWLVELKSNADFDKVLEAELNYIYQELEKFVPDVRLVQIARLPYDFHNVKVLLKSQILQREGGERRFDLLTPLGNIDTDDLILAVESEDYRLLPFGLHRAVPRSVLLFEQTHDILEVEKYLDSVLFMEMTKIAEASGVDTVWNWLKGKIDSENLRNLLRLKRFDMDPSGISPFLHEGGFVSTEKLVGLIGEPVESWSRDLSFADIGLTLHHLQEVSDLGSLIVQIEKVLDEYISRILYKSRYGAFSPENVLHFLWLKEMETKNLRIILVAIANHTDKEVVRGLLRRG